MRLVFISFLIILTLISCKSEPFSHDEKEIFQLVFDRLKKPVFILPPPQKELVESGDTIEIFEQREAIIKSRKQEFLLVRIYYHDHINEYSIVDKDLKKDFQPLLDKLQNPRKFQIDSSEFLKIFQFEENWELSFPPPKWRFQRPYPGMTPEYLMKFSRIVFNQRKTKALISIGYNLNHLAGEGGLLFLEKVNGTWVEKDYESKWFS